VLSKRVKQADSMTS